MNIKILNESAEIVRRYFRGARPACGLILGSGWDGVVEAFHPRRKIPYARLPAMGKTRVAGHAGFLVWAKLAGIETFIFQGRHHWYEGAGWEPVALPIYILKQFGAQAVVLTNAAGGMRADLQCGSLMAIRDHINFMGVNPLLGNRDKFWGAPFADQSNVYDRQMRVLLAKTARRCNIKLKTGTYLAVSGPVYETPAEISAFKKLGADAVGMSTVPEAMLASAAGLKVAGLSLISNPAAGLGKTALSHEAVQSVARKAQEKVRILLEGFWREMAKEKLL